MCVSEWVDGWVGVSMCVYLNQIVFVLYIRAGQVVYTQPCPGPFLGVAFWACGTTKKKLLLGTQLLLLFLGQGLYK